MPIFEKLYHLLFNAVTDAVERMPEGEARTLLIESQQECEELYIEDGDEPAGE